MVHVTGDPGFPAWTNGVDASLAGKVDTATANATYARAGIDATQRLMALLKNETRNASILVCSDSTAVTTDRWVYRLAGLLAADWPRWTVVFRWWDDVSASYGSVAQPDVTIQTGTGPRTLTIYNAAISGASVTTWQGIQSTAAALRRQDRRVRHAADGDGGPSPCHRQTHRVLGLRLHHC